MKIVARVRLSSATLLLLPFLLLIVYGCGSDGSPSFTPGRSTDSVTVMKLTSRGFENDEKLDVKFTVEGEDLSPPLSWSETPPGTKSFALICDDPDAPSPQRPAAEPWVHWVIFNIPANRTELPQGVSREPEPSETPGARQGLNSWPSENVGYRGPAPPPGSGQHRYFFKLYALDAMLELNPGATKQQLLEAMSGHVLGEGRLVGVYER